MINDRESSKNSDTKLINSETLVGKTLG